MGIGGYRWVEGGYRWVPPGSPPPYHPRSLLVEKIFFMESFQYIAVGFLWVICGIPVGYLWDSCGLSVGYLWDSCGLSVRLAYYFISDTLVCYRFLRYLINNLIIL